MGATVNRVSVFRDTVAGSQEGKDSRWTLTASASWFGLLRFMKITVSSPDGLGDFVLRIPFFEALRDAGHELQIFMYPPAYELASTVLPTARIEKISDDPYARLVRFRRKPFTAELKKIKTFAPDLLVIALFQQSFFDEICLSKLSKHLSVAGFRSRDSFWSTAANTRPQDISKRFSLLVEVRTDLPEVEKNRSLAAAILGSPFHVGRPEFRLRKRRLTMRDPFFGSTRSARDIGWCAPAAGPVLRSRTGAKQTGRKRLLKLPPRSALR